MEPTLTLAALLSALFVMLFVRLLFPAPRRLSSRVRPYSIGSRTSLGGSADVRAVSSGGYSSGSALVGIFRPMLDATARRLDRLIDRQGDRHLAAMIRQAGLFPDLPESERLGAYRIRQLGNVAAWGGVALLLAPLIGLSVAQFLGVEFLLLIVGATRQRGRLERAIEDRRNRMTIEIYTVNQLLAMRVRAGGGVISAVSAICSRGSRRRGVGTEGGPATPPSGGQNHRGVRSDRSHHARAVLRPHLCLAGHRRRAGRRPRRQPAVAV